MAKPVPEKHTWTLPEVAEVFDVDAEKLERAIKKGLPCHAFEKDGQWMVPARGLRALLGFAPVQMLSIAHVAELLDANYHSTFRSLKKLKMVHEITGMGIQRVKLPALLKLIG